MRIVKATQASRWNKVKALQRLLTSSFSGKALAVKRVTENEGKKTAGVEGEKNACKGGVDTGFEHKVPHDNARNEVKREAANSETI